MNFKLACVEKNENRKQILFGAEPELKFKWGGLIHLCFWVAEWLTDFYVYFRLTLLLIGPALFPCFATPLPRSEVLDKGSLSLPKQINDFTYKN